MDGQISKNADMCAHDRLHYRVIAIKASKS